MFEPQQISPHKPMAIGDALSIQGAPTMPDGIHRLVFIDPVTSRHIFKLLNLPDQGEGASKLEIRRATRRKLLNSLSPAKLDSLLKSETALHINFVESPKRLSTPGKLKGRSREIYSKNEVILRAMCHSDLLYTTLVEESPKELFSLAVMHLVSRQKVTRLFNRLLDHGLDPVRAAMTGYARCGRRANVPSPSKQGRRRKMVQNELGAQWKGVNTLKHDRTNIATFIASAGYKPDDSLQTNFREFRARYAFKQIQNLENGSVIKDTLPEDEFLTYSQFRYHFNRILPALYNRLSHKTKRAIDARIFRIHTKSARMHIPAPGYTLLIDSTVADVYLVCSFDRTKLIGRPLLYFVVDGLTSAVVGVHITLRTQTAREAKIALFSAMTDKSQLLSKYNLGSYSHLFPKAPLCHTILPDRGELNSKAATDASFGLGCDLGMPAPYMPEWKGIVERLFKTINNLTIHWVPGSTRGRARERGNRDVRLDAVLTLEEFTRLILIGILMWNQCGKTTDHLLPEALLDDVTPGPASYFDWGLDNLHGSPRFLPEDELVTRMLEPKAANLGGTGIDLDGNRWVGEWMKDPMLTFSGLIEKPVELYRHPTQPLEAFVRLEGEQILRTVTMFEPPLTGTEFDLEEFKTHEQAVKGIHQIKAQSLQTSLYRNSADTVIQAKQLTKQAQKRHPQSNAGFINGLSENRAAEIAHNDRASPAMEPTPLDDSSIATRLAGEDFLAGLANISRNS